MSPKPSSDLAVRVHDLSFSYRYNPLFKHLSFRIKEGEFIGIIGPNGGGKTTLMRLMMGFLQPTHGEIFLFGKLPVEQRSLFAYVPQNIRFDRQFPLSLLDLVLMGRIRHLSWWGRYSASDKQAAEQAMRRLGIWQLRENAVGTLSGGELQRGLIARALVSSPKILFLDEPTANVDVKAEAEIYALLRELKGEITILMVTHDLRTVVEHVDRILCVQGGVVSMLPQEVCAHFAVGLYHTPLVTLGDQEKREP